jgi:hypothetical protein
LFTQDDSFIDGQHPSRRPPPARVDVITGNGVASRTAGRRSSGGGGRGVLSPRRGPTAVNAVGAPLSAGDAIALQQSGTSMPSVSLLSNPLANAESSRTS